MNVVVGPVYKAGHSTTVISGCCIPGANDEHEIEEL